MCPYNWRRLWEYLSFGEINTQSWQVRVQTQKKLLVPSIKISFSTLSKGRIGRLVYIPRILIGASLEVGVTCLMERILGTCSWRLTIYEGSYAVGNEEGLLQVRSLLLMMIGTTVTGLDQRLLLVSLFHAMRIAIIRGEVRVHLAKVWVTMP